MTPPARMIFTDPPYNVPINGHVRMVLFKCLLIGQWHGLSDPNLERALKVRLDFMLFCGLDLHAPVPDECIAAFAMHWSRAGFMMICWPRSAARSRITG